MTARILCLCIVLIGITVLPARAEIKIGILARSGATVCLERWSGLGAYLEEQLQETVYILPLEFDLIEQVVAEESIDYLLANPYYYVTLKDRFNLRAIATQLTSWQNTTLSRFAGVIFVPDHSQIQTLADLRGRELMVVDYSSFGGCSMARELLRSHGLDSSPSGGAVRLVKGVTHENVVLAVTGGLLEAGTVRSGILEKMAAREQIRMEDVRVLNQQANGFPLVHSTRLYPEWPITALAHVKKSDADRMTRILLSMSPSNPAARQAGIAGWVSPASYTVVEEVVSDLKPATP